MKKYLSRILFETIPTILMYKLANLGSLVLRRRRSTTEDHEETFDLVDAGPRHRFTVLGDQPMIVHNSTGHDVTLRFIYHIGKIREERSVPMCPWLLDKHDATTWQVNTKYLHQGVEAFEEAYRRLNAELQWSVQITGKVKTGSSMAEVEL